MILSAAPLVEEKCPLDPCNVYFPHHRGRLTPPTASTWFELAAPANARSATAFAEDDDATIVAAAGTRHPLHLQARMDETKADEAGGKASSSTSSSSSRCALGLRDGSHLPETLPRA